MIGIIDNIRVMRSALIILMAGLFMPTFASSSSRGVQTSLTPIEAIEADYQKGDITLDERVLHIIQAIKSPRKLPVNYQPQSIIGPAKTTRCVTMVLRDIIQNFELLSTSTQTAFQTSLARFETDFTFDSPGGFFKLHYNIAPTVNGVSAVDSDSSGVPDFVEKCAAYCDSSHTRRLELGYLEPVSDGGLGGDDKLDVYFSDMSSYGYAIPEGAGPMPWWDSYGYLVLNNDFLGFAPNDDPEGSQWGAAKVTAAHEYHHLVQFAYDSDEERWSMELDAVFMEEMVFDQSNDCYNYLDEFFTFPQKSLMENSNHYYSSFPWELYLAQKFDTSLMRAAWEGARFNPTLFEALSDSLSGRYGWTIDSAFAEFSLWNYCTNFRDDGLHHEEAADYPAVNVGMSFSTYPVPLQNSPGYPAGYGATYVEFYPGADTGTLVLNFNGSDSREWAAWVILSTSETNHQFQAMELASGTFHGEIKIMHFENYFRATLVGANLMEYSNGVAFTYRAEIQPPYELASQLLTVGSEVYSGGVRTFQYQIINPSPLNDVVDVRAWDEQGWTTPVIVDYAIGAGEDTVFTFDIQSPLGAPFGDTSTLFFAVESWGDPSIADTQTVLATTVLQRGDLNFSGHIDISDLVYMVDYVFTGGPAPVPVLNSGDFVCDDGIDISDLVGLVDFMFSGGNPPSCNPY